MILMKEVNSKAFIVEELVLQLALGEFKFIIPSPEIVQ